MHAPVLLALGTWRTIVKVYSAPKSELGGDLIPKREALGKVLSWLSIGALLLFIGTTNSVIQMIRVFQEVTVRGSGDPELMAGGISQSLVPMVLSLVVSLPSLICIFLVLFLSTYRSKIFFRIWVSVTIILLLSFPIGTPFGLVLGIILFFKRNEFRVNA